MRADEEVKDLVRQLEPVLGGKARILWYKYLTAKDFQKKMAWDRRIRLIAEQALKTYDGRITLPPPAKGQCIGDYDLGQVIYPARPYSSFGLREEELCRHVMITGMTGVGKTTAAMQLIRQLKRQGKPFLVMDWQKEYSKLKKTAGFDDLIVVKIGNGNGLKFNPLIPPAGTDVKEWVAKLVDVINHAYLGGYGTEYILRDVLVKAYEMAGTFEGKDAYPNFSLVKHVLKKNFFRGRMELWNQTAIRILESLTYEGGLGPVLNTGKDSSLKGLLKSDVVIELDRLSSDDKKFLTEALLLWIYEFRKNQGESAGLRHAIIIEEAHNILNKKKETSQGGETIMETTLRMIRKFGEAVIVIDQEPSKLSESIKANTSVKITFTLGNGKDIQDISRSLELGWQDTKFLDMLKTGHALVKVKGRIEKPILVLFHHNQNTRGGYPP